MDLVGNVFFIFPLVVVVVGVVFAVVEVQCLNLITFAFLLLFALVNLKGIASGVALGGSINFNSRAKTTMSVIINNAAEASNTIYKATGPMRKISVNLQRQATETYGVDSVDGPYTSEIAGTAHFLASTSDKPDYAASGIERQAQKNKYSVEKGLTILYILTIITISLKLAATIALTVFGILRFQRALHL